MAEENISQEFRMKIKEETRNYFIKGIDQNELTSYNHKVLYDSKLYWTVFLA